jgi:hypothetical protein
MPRRRWLCNSFLNTTPKAGSIKEITDMSDFIQIKNNSAKESVKSWAPMAHACNSRNSGGRDQEDRSSKPVPGK